MDRPDRPKTAIKRTVDMQVIADWMAPGARVLDLGCGRGVLLDFLTQSRAVRGVGVDLDVTKIGSCVRRGVAAYQGDMVEFMRAFPAGHFDHVICSRTLEELPEPAVVIAEALRVGQALAVSFVNHAYWRNRLGILRHGRKLRNAVYTTPWHASRPANPVTISDFEAFCAAQQIQVVRRVHLRADWQTPCAWRPNWLAGYALYDLARAGATVGPGAGATAGVPASAAIAAAPRG